MLASQMPQKAPILERTSFIMLPGQQFSGAGLKELSVNGLVACKTTPAMRYGIGTLCDLLTSATYGAFMTSGAVSTDTLAFGIPSSEA